MPNSAWTETASSTSLVVVTTPVDGSSPENVNYLTNADKITLMAQYAAMLATKTTLDETAASLSISSSFYDAACGDISSALITAGAPTDWATIWPDGITSGPWPNIQGDLANLWAQIASQQTALQTAISSSQAATSQENSIAAALALLPGQSIVPNGAFGTGDSTGWVNQAGASIASLFGTLPDSAKGLIMPTDSAISHSFPVVNGQVYALTFQAWGVTGNSGVHLRIYYGSVAAPNLSDGLSGTETGYVDVFTGALPTALPGTATQYQWTAPAGATYASVALFNAGATGTVYLQGVQVIPYVMAQNVLAGAITAGALAVGAAVVDLERVGTLDGDLIDVINLNADNITTGTLAASQVLFPDGSAMTTASRVLTSPYSSPSRYIVPDNNHDATPFAWTMTAESANDTFVFNIALYYLAGTGMASPQIFLIVDGNLTYPAVTLALPSSGTGWMPVLASTTGLAAGTHTMSFYVYGANGYTFYAGSYAVAQRIY